MLLVCLLQSQIEPESCDQASVHPLTPFESPPVADMEMLLVEHIFQTLVPPVCCHQCHTVHPLPCSTLFVCSSWLNTHFQNLMDLFTDKQRQMAVNEFRRLIWTCQAVLTHNWTAEPFHKLGLVRGCFHLSSVKVRSTAEAYVQ